MKKDDLKLFIVDIMLIDATCGDVARAVAIELGIPCTVDGEGPHLASIQHHYRSAYEVMEWTCQVSNGTWDMAGNRLVFHCPKPEDDTFNLKDHLKRLFQSSERDLKWIETTNYCCEICRTIFMLPPEVLDV